MRAAWCWLLRGANCLRQAAYEAKQAALEAWLDGESAYRLEVEKAKEAKQGAVFARSQYEKWKATTLDTQDRLDAMNAKYPKQKADIAAERCVRVWVSTVRSAEQRCQYSAWGTRLTSKTIMRLVGIH